MNVYKLNNKYMSETPYAVMISDRLSQLNAIYGKSTVFKCFTNEAMDNTLAMHLQNLTLTFGEMLVADVTKIVYGKQAIKTHKAS